MNVNIRKAVISNKELISAVVTWELRPAKAAIVTTKLQGFSHGV